MKECTPHVGHTPRARQTVRAPRLSDHASGGVNQRTWLRRPFAAVLCVVAMLGAGASLANNIQIELATLQRQLNRNLAGSGMANDVVEDFFEHQKQVAFKIERHALIETADLHVKVVFMCSQQLRCRLAESGDEITP